MSRIIGPLQARIRRYFGFSRSETNGTLVLLSLLFAGFLLVQSFPLWLAGPALSDQEIDMARLELLAAQLDARTAPKQGRMPAVEKNRDAIPAIHPVPFDPNTATVEELQSLGLPEWLATRVTRYRDAGGRFRIKRDLAKIYGMEADTYEQLAPYIQLPEREEKKAFAERRDVREDSSAKPSRAETKPAYIPLEVFDLNTADTATLRRIRGIGPALSGRIIAYREKLGGFREMSQLREVWGLSDTVIFRLEDWAYISEEPALKPLSVNAASEEALRNHPYIGRNLARSLVRYREQHGNFSSEADLYKLYTIDSATVEKLRPYLVY